MTRSAHVLALGPLLAELGDLLDWQQHGLAIGEVAFVRLFEVWGNEAVEDLRAALGLRERCTFELDGRQLLGENTYDALVDLTFEHRVVVRDLTSLRRLAHALGWKFYLRLEGNDP